MSEVENLDVMLGTFSRNELTEQENNSEMDLELESGRQQQSTCWTEKKFQVLFEHQLK